MLNAAIDHAKDCQQATPGIVPPLQHLFTVLIGLFAQSGLQRGDGVILVIERLAQQQHIALLRRHQEDQAHHHRQRCFVEFRLTQVAQQRAIAVLIHAIKRLHQHFHRLSHLVAQLVCHFLLVVGAG